MIKQHPTLPILCNSETGEVSKDNGITWLLGIDDGKDHLRVSVKGTQYFVHRLMMQTFIGFSDECVDHIDRNPRNNVLSNLHYCDARTNALNSDYADKAFKKYGVRESDDKKSYNQAYHKAHADKRSEQHKAWRKANIDMVRSKDRAKQKSIYAQKRAEGFHYVTCPDGKRRWVKEAS